MAKQTFVTGQVLTAAQQNALQANDYNQTVSAKVASYVLVAADAGTRITMSNAGATTITVNTSLFAAGDTLFITNIGAGACTITAGTATVSTASSLVLAQYDSGRLYFTSTGVAIWEKYAGASGAAAFSGCAAYLSGAQSTTSSTPTAILFDTELYDTDSFHSNVTNKERFTIPAGKAGYYLVTAQVQWTTGLTGYRDIYLMLNAATVIGQAFAIVDNAGYPTPQCSVIVYLTVGDYVWATGEQSSGGALTMRSGRGATTLSLGYLGA